MKWFEEPHNRRLLLSWVYWCENIGLWKPIIHLERNLMSKKYKTFRIPFYSLSMFCVFAFLNIFFNTHTISISSFLLAVLQHSLWKSFLVSLKPNFIIENVLSKQWNGTAKSYVLQFWSIFICSIISPSKLSWVENLKKNKLDLVPPPKCFVHKSQREYFEGNIIEYLMIMMMQNLSRLLCK